MLTNNCEKYLDGRCVTYLMFNSDCEVLSVDQSSLIVHPMWEKVRKLKLDIPGSAFASYLFMMPLTQLLFFSTNIALAV